MTDAVKESAAEIPESGAPAPKLSESSPGQRPSEPSGVDQLAKAFDERFAKLEATIPELVKRTVQSVKDVRLGRQETEIAEIKARLDAAGGDVKKVARDIQIDELLNRDLQPADRGGSDWEREWREGSDKILRSALDEFGVKIERTDKDFLEVQSGEYKSPADAYAAVTRLVARKAKQASAPEAAAATEGQPSPVQTTDLESLSAQLEHARQSGAPRKVREELMAKMKEALARAG